jgi:hypothetical protein
MGVFKNVQDAMRKRVPKLLMASAGVAFLIYGCGKSPYQTAEIKPGEPDYPQENPTPVHTLSIASNFPDDPKVRLVARYRASPRRWDMDARSAPRRPIRIRPGLELLSTT